MIDKKEEKAANQLNGDKEALAMRRRTHLKKSWRRQRRIRSLFNKFTSAPAIAQLSFQVEEILLYGAARRGATGINSRSPRNRRRYERNRI